MAERAERQNVQKVEGVEEIEKLRNLGILIVPEDYPAKQNMQQERKIHQYLVS